MLGGAPGISPLQEKLPRPQIPQFCPVGATNHTPSAPGTLKAAASTRSKNLMLGHGSSSGSAYADADNTTAASRTPRVVAHRPTEAVTEYSNCVTSRNCSRLQGTSATLVESYPVLAVTAVLQRNEDRGRKSDLNPETTPYGWTTATRRCLQSPPRSTRCRGRVRSSASATQSRTRALTDSLFGALFQFRRDGINDDC